VRCRRWDGGNVEEFARRCVAGGCSGLGKEEQVVARANHTALGSWPSRNADLTSVCLPSNDFDTMAFSTAPKQKY
jgi:hypothetical protein